MDQIDRIYYLKKRYTDYFGSSEYIETIFYFQHEKGSDSRHHSL